MDQIPKISLATERYTNVHAKCLQKSHRSVILVPQNRAVLHYWAQKQNLVKSSSAVIAMPRLDETEKHLSSGWLS